jgi:predicted DNA-binding transcriptional regulator YafY
MSPLQLGDKEVVAAAESTISETALQASAKLGRCCPRGSGATTLVAACQGGERLRFDYHDHNGTARPCDVEPYRLVSWGQRRCLVTWDAGYED